MAHGRAELEPAEYEETKAETMDQLKEFQVSLNKLAKGDMSLVDEIGAMQLVSACMAVLSGRLSRRLCLRPSKHPKSFACLRSASPGSCASDLLV